MSALGKIKGIIKKNTLLKKLADSVYFGTRQRYFKYHSSRAKTNSKLVIFDSFQGRKYTCSPKAIYEYMSQSEAYSDYEFVWVFRNPEKEFESQMDVFDNRTRLVKFDSFQSFKLYAQAKYWITNSRLRAFMYPREDQLYCQCWHGTPLKKIGCDITVAGNATSESAERIYAEYTAEAQRINMMISPSAFCTEKLISAFDLKKYGKENIVIEKGYPRNDSLFTFDNAKIDKIKLKLGISRDKKCILYAPTFRDNQYTDDGYSLKLELDFDSLKNQLGDDWVVLFRAHYFIADKFDFKKYAGFVVNVSDYDEINDLYIIGDMLITDYSSVLFDYANLSRPMIFYIYDYDDYKNKMRDFYFDLSFLPGEIVKTQQEVEDEINRIADCIKTGESPIKPYEDKHSKFKKKFNYLDDAHASRRVADEIFK